MVFSDEIHRRVGNANSKRKKTRIFGDYIPDNNYTILASSDSSAFYHENWRLTLVFWESIKDQSDRQKRPDSELSIIFGNAPQMRRCHWRLRGNTPACSRDWSRMTTQTRNLYYPQTKPPTQCSSREVSCCWSLCPFHIESSTHLLSASANLNRPGFSGDHFNWVRPLWSGLPAVDNIALRTRQGEYFRSAQTADDY